VREFDPGRGGKVCRGACRLDESWEPGDVVGLHVRLEHRDDRRPGPLRLGEVGIDELDVRVDDGEVVELGNTIVRALATPGHAPAHHAYVVADRRRGDEEPWLTFTGDSLLVGDVGRPDLHAGGDPEPLARALHGSIGRLLELEDGVLVYPSHYGGSVCGRALSSNPFSTIGFERTHNQALAYPDAESFAAALLDGVPPEPADQAAIVAANRTGRIAVQA